MEKNYKEEKRKHKRINVVHLSSPIELKFNNSKDIIPGVITDISSKGLGILSFKRINEDSTIHLKLHLDKLKTGNIISKVIWTKQKDDTYRAGLQFINISPKDFFNIYNYVSTNLDKKTV